MGEKSESGENKDVSREVTKQTTKRETVTKQTPRERDF